MVSPYYDQRKEFRSVEIQNLPIPVGVTLILESGLYVFLRECQTRRIVIVEKRARARY
ncbi:hypothetical protein RUE5091_02567 [Ruegeria denitrificans]|uniref:Uncharacterized protein n=1 Tax=Ruegeria denitrificans TaxID=1715692 RepID=A0A0P1IBQ8_9RHOB|nr:hypothetical protein RUE5091_02567 [Ruegeria denitrificans]